ncbi:MAG: O-antigen ligase family protein [bacterium]|nr:O-antigen ligase family protein [bacterium]
MSTLTFKTFLRWLDDNLLLILAGFLLAFIPLYPKIPLFSPIEQYIVRVRIEDIFIFFTAIVWLVQVLRKKITYKTPLTWLIVGYAVVGLLSVLSAVFITGTVPLQPLHLGKTLLHYFRYLEYFSLFFFTFSAIKTRKDIMTLVAIFGLTIIAISLYGYGQKYHYWPVYSTMNREFSKGLRLYLTPHARVQSTFGGHYDMAAYLVLALPLVMSLGLAVRRKALKYALFAAFWLGTWLMIVSASRAAFVAYLAGVGFTVSMFALSQQNWRERISYGLKRMLFFGFTIGVLFMVYGEDMSERLGQVIDSNPELRDQYHEFNRQRKELVASIITGDFSRPASTPPPNSISTDDAITQGILTPTDERPVTTRPTDVYVDVPDQVTVATVSASGQTEYIVVEKDRTWSECALKNSLSLCIRLDTLWPRAIEGFTTNPLLGKGYATLNKESNEQFTEAESTDNNFLRTLGETGLLGFITFYGTILFACWLAFKRSFSQDALVKGLSIGFLAASLGLLLNAVYIDVFAASKVALSYWGLTGLVLGALFILPVKAATEPTATKEVSTQKKKQSRTSHACA